MSAWSGGARVAEFNVAQPALARAFARAAQSVPLATWQHYLRLRVLEHSAPALPRAFADAHFDVDRRRDPRHPHAAASQRTRDRRHRRARTAAPRWARRWASCSSRAPTRRWRSSALAMVADIRQAMRQRQALTWMSAPTKAAAQAKLDAMVAQIGHPAEWRRYEGLDIREGDYAGNLLRAERWWQAQRLAELDRPFDDRTRWQTSANTVNAFAASANRIVFPAGILQPPFFDPAADDAQQLRRHRHRDRPRDHAPLRRPRPPVRRGGQPARLVDARGRGGLPGARRPRGCAVATATSRCPACASTAARCWARTCRLRRPADRVRRPADRARRRRKAGETVPLVEGRTPEQRFFIANAMLWRGKQREASLLNQLRTGQHSPGRYRLLGPISQHAGFAKAFGCRAGDAMVAADPIVVW